MIVRRLEKKDLYDAGLVSHIAFHFRAEDIEAERAKWENNPAEEDWGAFTEDGQIMARIINNHFESRIDGHPVRNGGIGEVSTLPEYRGTGAVRGIFDQLLPEARKNGEVISTLYPFLHAFYRKFGYETLTYRNRFTLTPAQLKGCPQPGWVRQWKPGDEVGEFTRIYTRFAEGYNLAIARDDRRMGKEHVGGLFYKDRRFAYLMGDGTEPNAYVVFQDIHDPEGARMEVREIAWTDRKGFLSALGFLSRFTADYRGTVIYLPTNLDLRVYAQNPYEIKYEPQCDHMIRVVNAEKLLALIDKPDGKEFVISVSGDAQIPENNGTWLVRGNEAVPTDRAPDLSVSVRALGQMAVGGIELGAAELREDVEVFSNRETLRNVFRRKPIFVGDHF